MRRPLFMLVALAALAFGGFALAGAVGTTGTVSVCVGARVQAQTIAANGKPVATIPGLRNVDCRTVTYTVPTQTATTVETQLLTRTETTTETTTLPGTTVTQPVTTTTVETVTQPVTTTLPAQTVTTTQTVTQPVTTTVTQTVTVPGGSLVKANLFVAPNGSTSCGRSAALVPFGQAAGSACDSFQHAYAQAKCGDTILVEPWTYGAQEVDRGTDKACGAGTCDQFQANLATPPSGTTTGCVTIEPDLSAAGGWQVAGFWSNATYLRLDGLGVLVDGGGLAFVGRSGGKTGKSDTCSAGYGHDDIAQNLTVDGHFDGISGHGTFDLIGAHNVSLIHDTIGNALTTGAAGTVNQWNDCKGMTTFSQSADNMLADSTIHDLVELPTATGHMECIHDDISTGPVAILSNTFLNCNEQNISVQTTSAADLVVGLDIEGNLFQWPAEGAAAMGYKIGQIGSVVIICSYGGGTIAGYRITGNTFLTSNGRFGGPQFQQDRGACTLTGVSTPNSAIPG